MVIWQRQMQMKIKNINKLQIVVKDELPEEIKEKSVIISHIGRVYNILINLDDKNLEILLKSPEVVQYDRLEMKVEDYFYMEEGAK